MEFLHSAFIENTPEARKWLESLGYEGLAFFQGGKYLYATSSTHANAKHTWEEPYFATTNSLNEVMSYGYINCLGNQSLFKAVTAMEDDSDYMQWYYNQYYNEWSICEQDNAFDYFKLDWMIHARKATLEELIEHFKK